MVYAIIDGIYIYIIIERITSTKVNYEQRDKYILYLLLFDMTLHFLIQLSHISHSLVFNSVSNSVSNDICYCGIRSYDILSYDIRYYDIRSYDICYCGIHSYNIRSYVYFPMTYVPMTYFPMTYVPMTYVPMTYVTIT